MRKTLFLYLAIACFAGLIAIFVVDGYIGIYDTVRITAGEQSWTVEADFWLRERSSYDSPTERDKTTYYIPLNRGEKIFFRYEIDNRTFSTYSTPIQASVWKENEKIIDLFAEDELIKPFDKATVEWTLSTQELEKAGFGVDTSTNYTVKIKHGEVERRIIVNFYSEEPPYSKVVPPPSR